MHYPDIAKVFVATTKILKHGIENKTRVVSTNLLQKYRKDVLKITNDTDIDFENLSPEEWNAATVATGTAIIITVAADTSKKIVIPDHVKNKIGHFDNLLQDEEQEDQGKNNVLHSKL